MKKHGVRLSREEVAALVAYCDALALEVTTNVSTSPDAYREPLPSLFVRMRRACVGVRTNIYPDEEAT